MYKSFHSKPSELRKCQCNGEGSEGGKFQYPFLRTTVFQF